MSTTFGTASALGLPAIEQSDDIVLSASAGAGYLVKPAGDLGEVGSYSLVFDLLIPSDAPGTFGGLFQTDPTNSGDADLFLRKASGTTAGVGIDGQYEGEVTLGDWHRLAFTVSDNADGTATLVKYIDGEAVGSQSVDAARFAFDSAGGFLLLTDNDGEVFPGFISSFLFADRPFTAEEVAALGGPDANGILKQQLKTGSAVEFGFDGGDFAPTLGEGTMTPSEASPLLDDAETLGVPPVPDDAGLLAFPAATSEGGFLVTPGVEGALSSYSLVFDLLIPSEGLNSSFGALFQTDLSNSGDADFFLRASSPTSFGIGIAGQYDGSGDYDNWHRIAVTLEDQGDGSALMSKYIDGVKVGEQTVDSERFTINGDDGFLLLTDESNETNAGFLNSFLISDQVLSEDEIAALGGPTADGILSLPPDDGKATQFDFDQGDLEPTFGPGTMTDREADSGEALVEVVDPIQDLLVTPDADNLVIDLNSVFEGEDLTFTVENSDGSVLSVVPSAEGILELDFAAFGFSDIKVTASDGEGNSASDSFRARVAGENAFTIAVMPDTQNYTSDPGRADTFGDITQWLADNAAAKNLQFVLHVGDVTENNTASQWEIARQAYEALDGVVPYSVLSGNHDQGSGGSASDFSSRITEYFRPEDYAVENGGTLGGTYKGDMGSNYHTFTAPDGTKWMVLSLEFGARDDVIRWAEDAIENHLDHRIILANHYYMNFTDRGNPLSGPLTAEPSGYNYGLVRSPENATDGEQLWRDLASKYPNVSFTFSGHVFGDGAETLVSYSDYGTPVHQMVVNYQFGVSGEIVGNGVPGRGSNGGNGAVRLLTIDPDNDTVWTETYFTEFDEYLTGSRDTPEYNRDGLTGAYREHQEVIENVDMGAPQVFAKAKAGDDQFVTAEGDADEAKVTLDASGSIDPNDEIVSYLWLDAEGQEMASGETVEVALAGGRHDLTLVTTDVNGVKNSDDLRIMVTTERTLLLDNFNDGDFDGWIDVNQIEEQPLEDLIAIGTPASFGIGDLPGGDASVLSFPRSTGNQGYEVSLDFEPESGDRFSQYSLVFDIYFPDQDGNFAAFFQTNVANLDDGEAFRRGDGGIGISGVYDGNVTLDAWHRVAFTFEDQGGSLLLRKYIDGAKVGEQSVDPDRFSIDPDQGFLVFTDDNGEVFNGFLGSLLFTADLLDDDAIAVLGGADADGILTAEAAGARALQFDFQGTAEPTFGEGSIGVVDLASDGARATWQVKGTVASRDGNDDGEDLPAPQGALYEYSDGSAALIWEDSPAKDWSDYVVEVTVLSQDDDRFGLIFYYQDADNHYRLTLDTQGNARQLIKVQEGEETVLAESARGYRFNDEMDLRVAVVGDSIYATLDGQQLFGGPVVDGDSPLAGGTVGLLSAGQYQSVFDDVLVQEASVTAHAGSDQHLVDVEGDNRVEVELDASGSYAPGGVQSYGWWLAGEEIASGQHAQAIMASGLHEITLRVTDGQGETHEDLVKIAVFNQDQVMLRDDFQSESDSWTFVDEGELGDPAAWSLADGKLSQTADTYSRELVPGSEAGGVWNNTWSPLGDGWHALRKGTYALHDAEGAYGWTDYAVETRFTASEAGGVGLLFHYQDAENYYKLELDSDDRFVQLVVLVAGIEQTLMLTRNDFSLDEEHLLRVEVRSGQIQAYLDDLELFADPVEDRSIVSGTVGLYSWGTEGVDFEDVLVRALDAEASDAVAGLRIEGGDDDERLVGAAGDDVILAGRGSDTAGGREGNDRIDGGRDDDRLSGGDGADNLRGGRGDDEIRGGSGEDVIGAGRGDDLVFGGLGDDRVVGSHGDDTLRGSLGDDRLAGDGDDDRLFGGEGNDGLFGSRDDDRLKGGSGDDSLYGGRDDDLLVGGSGNDRLFGGRDDDRLKGEEGDDTLFGEEGDDILRGGAGDDTLDGGEGDDTLAGQGGEDRFVFTADGGSGIETVTGFKPGEDSVALNGFSLSDFTALLAAADNAGDDVVIDLNEKGRELRLTGLDKDELSEEDFLFNVG
ncbi:MAG: hypothetical protein Kilf2KO_35140 [Rhodospirillales bacterium]